MKTSYFYVQIDVIEHYEHNDSVNRTLSFDCTSVPQLNFHTKSNQYASSQYMVSAVWMTCPKHRQPSHTVYKVMATQNIYILDEKIWTVSRSCILLRIVDGCLSFGHFAPNQEKHSELWAHRPKTSTVTLSFYCSFLNVL